MLRRIAALLFVAAFVGACGDRVEVKGRGGSQQDTEWGLKLKLPPPE